MFPFRIPFGGLLAVVAILATAATPSVADEKWDAIPRRMQEFVDAGQISGAVTLVGHEGKVVHLEAVGQADIENELPMAPDSIFAIASMTKPITATALLTLVDEGKVSLEDPVARYIPEFGDAKLEGGPLKRPVTLRDLLTHTSGLVGSQQNTGSLEETARRLARRPLGFQPGERWQYSPGITVCGRVIEVASGQPYDEFLADRVFTPLAMVDTTFHPTPQQQKRIVKLYKPGPEAGTLEAASHWINELSEDRTPNPSGGLFSTAADMARFYQMVLAGGRGGGRRIVSPAAVKEMTSVQTGELTTGFTPGNGWGWGWCVVRQPQGVSAMLSPGSFGHGGAFGTQGWVDPVRKTIFVLMIQRTDFGNSDASEIRTEFQRLAVEALKVLNTGQQ